MAGQEFSLQVQREAAQEARAADGSLRQSLVQLAPADPPALRHARPRPVVARRPQSEGVPAVRGPERPQPWRPRTRPFSAPTGACWRNSIPTTTRGSPATSRRTWPTTTSSPTSAPSTACTTASRSTRAASASSPAITARPRATCACRSSPSACCIGRDTSPSASTRTASSSRSTATRPADELPVAPGAQRRGPGNPRAGRIPGPQRRHQGLARRRRPRAGAAARHRRGRERSGRSQDHAGALRRRPVHAHPAGDRARRRRRARAARRGIQADGLAHQRGSRGVHGGRAPPRTDGPGPAVPGGARGGRGLHGVHDAHPRDRGPRRLPPRHGARPVQGPIRELGITDGRVARPRPLGNGDPSLQHDAARDQRRAIHQRRQQDPRRRVVGHPRQRLARRAAAREPGRLRHQRRARADLPAAAVVGAARPAPRRRLALRAHGSPADRQASWTYRTGASGT